MKKLKNIKKDNKNTVSLDSREYYNIIANSYDELYFEEQKNKISEITRIFIKHGYYKLFCKNPKLTLLDLGCGTGISTILFTNENLWRNTLNKLDLTPVSEKDKKCINKWLRLLKTGTTIGIDISEKMIELAKKKVKQTKKIKKENITFIIDNIEELKRFKSQYKNMKFDITLAISSLQNTNVKKSLITISKITKRLAIITIPKKIKNINEIHNQIAKLKPKTYEETKDTIYFLKF